MAARVARRAGGAGGLCTEGYRGEGAGGKWAALVADGLVLGGPAGAWLSCTLGEGEGTTRAFVSCVAVRARARGSGVLSRVMDGGICQG